MIQFKVNGQAKTFDGDPEMPLLWYLRDVAELTGTKFGCGMALCGACTVHQNGAAIRSCTTAMSEVGGTEITTIEGLANGEQLHPLQAAFIEHDGFQCGYCTPGQIMSAAGLLKEGCPPEMTVRECMSGNICRCGAYPGIVAAIEEVRGTKA